MVIDASSGSVLEAVNADELRHPASLTKLMTLNTLFEALAGPQADARRAGPRLLSRGVPGTLQARPHPGTRITVEEAILGLVTKSANDAAAALGELLGGNEAGSAR